MAAAHEAHTGVPADGLALHASCVVVGETGILIVGPSGSGKTSLAMAIIEAGETRKAFTRLVADDRTLISLRNGRLVARPHPLIAGRYELRGSGVRNDRHESAATLRLVVQCQMAGATRQPEPGQRWTYAGVSLPSISVGLHDQRLRILQALVRDVETGLSQTSARRGTLF